MSFKLKAYFNNHFIQNLSKTFSLKSAELLLSFSSMLFLSNTLSTKDYGIFTYCFSWLNILAVIAIIGFDKLIIREVATLKETTKQAISAIFTSCSKIVLPLSFLLIIVILSYQFLKREQDLFLTLSITMIALPFFSLTIIRQAIFRGLKKSWESLFPDLFLRPFLFLGITILSYYFFNKHYNLFYITLFNAIAYIIAFMLRKYLLDKFMHQQTNSGKTEYIFAWKKQIPFFFSISALGLLSNQIDIVMLGFFDKIEEAGIYNVALRIGSISSILLYILNIVLSPTIAKLYSENKTEQLQLIITKNVRLLFLICLSIVIISALFSDQILSIFGEDYINGRSTLMIILLGQLFNVACGSVGYLLIMTKNEHLMLYSLGTSALINLILCIVLIPSLGIAGAAIAGTVSIVIWNIITTWLTYKQTGIYATIIGKPFWKKQ